MNLWTPESARLIAEQDQAVERQMSLAREFNRHLHEFDERMELVWAKEGSDEVGLMPGRWHIMRHNELGAPSFMVITGPSGEYREPDSSIMDELRARDLRNERAVRAAEERQRQKVEAVKRAEANARQERHDEIAERVAQIDRVSVSVPA